MYKLLIVEDDFIIAKGLQKHFEKYHYDVQYIEDFEHVLDEFLEFQPDLVLLDIHLPFFDGYYWCQEIRKISQVPIVFISSANENMNIVLAMNMGGDDFINKPFDLQVVQAKLQAMTGKDVIISMRQDPTIMGGIIIQIGDKRIDGSIARRLDELKKTLVRTDSIRLG